MCQWRISSQSFVFFSERHNFKVVPKRSSLFLSRKYKILKTILKRPSFFFFFFYSEIQNFKVERNDYPFFFSEKYKILKTLPGHSVFTTKHKIWKMHRNSHPFFFTKKYRILKVILKRPFVFLSRKYEI